MHGRHGRAVHLAVTTSEIVARAYQSGKKRPDATLDGTWRAGTDGAGGQHG
jgi:hypothetical protein